MAKLPKLPVKNYNKSLLINPNQKLLTPGQSAMMTMCTNFLNSPSVELHFNNFELTIGNFILFNGTNLGYEADVRNTVFYTTLLNICTELTLFNTFLSIELFKPTNKFIMANINPALLLRVINLFVLGSSLAFQEYVSSEYRKNGELYFKNTK